ncbi:MAG: carboxypeptidase-like regulatory domain-containing protein, partial [Acidobacteria bacterium]|nr:carboxypeptidase-like regulatory domain-containing protein [Acidobacteriota bacterium]
MKLSRMRYGVRSRARRLGGALCASVVVLTATALRAEVPGTATLSGTVNASQEFTAAQVYARNLDRDMVYQVYTNGGRYRAVALFPGTYEVSASTKHLESDVQTITVGAGDAAEVDLTLGPLSGDAPPLVIPAGRTAMESGRSGEVEYASYDEI